MIEGIGQVSGVGGVRSPLEPEPTAGAVAETQAGGFEDALKGLLSDSSGQLKHAEAVSVAGVVGKASELEVVSAVMEAEQKLQAAIAVRDKVVQAYLEISRMQI